MNLNKVKEFFVKKNVKSHQFQVMKIGFYVLLIVVLLLSIGVFKLSKEVKNIKVVALDEDRMPYPMEEKPKNISNLINYKTFIHYALDSIHSWHPKTIDRQLVKLKPITTDEAWESLIKEIKAEKLRTRVKENDITSVIEIYDYSDPKPYKDTDQFMMTITAFRIREIRDVHYENTLNKMKINIRFKRVNSTKDNFWGLKITYYDDQIIEDNKIMQ